MGLILYEDEHLLVANKPAAFNTHSPSPFAGEGLYEWLKNREPGHAELSILHRLDKETSGVIVFGKTTLANRALSSQFEEHRVKKSYLLLTDRPVTFESLEAKSCLVRVGDKYISRPVHVGGEMAETHFHEVRTHFADRVFDTVIPRTTRLAEAPSFGKPIIYYDKYSAGAAAYEVFTQEVLKRLKLI